jgi:hypothetical protein
MKAANDVTAQTRNATHSLSLTHIAGEFVVACFPLVNGVADTDREVFFEMFTDADQARRFYTRKAALLKCKAAQFDSEIDWVWRARASLGSCLYREVPNESRRLAAAMSELELCTLARRDAYREGRKLAALAAAADTLARRAVGLAEHIKTEAESRICLGQP